jgi:hypothetical protein
MLAQLSQPLEPLAPPEVYRSLLPNSFSFLTKLVHINSTITTNNDKFVCLRLLLKPE